MYAKNRTLDLFSVKLHSRCGNPRAVEVSTRVVHDQHLFRCEAIFFTSLLQKLSSWPGSLPCRTAARFRCSTCTSPQICLARFLFYFVLPFLLFLILSLSSSNELQLTMGSIGNSVSLHTGRSYAGATILRTNLTGWRHHPETSLSQRTC